MKIETVYQLINKAINERKFALLGGGIAPGIYTGTIDKISAEKHIATSRNNPDFKYLRLPLTLQIVKNGKVSEQKANIPLSAEMFAQLEDLQGEKITLKVEREKGEQYNRYSFAPVSDQSGSVIEETVDEI